jgi:tRNA G10  N-methylase Trm11
MVIGMYQYIYKLGHCEDLAVAEFSSLNKKTKYEVVNGWLKSNSDMNVNVSGSLVYGGVIIEEIAIDASSKDMIFNCLYEYITENVDELKKLGIAISKEYAKDILPLAKKAGSKKINVLIDKKPNYGNWKGLKNWILVEKISNKIVVMKLTSYSDQQFWTQIDTFLPHSDMKRGIINLKLARSLLNLTENTKVYDPLCGLGRLAVAGVDIKDSFVLSDIDESCLQECEKNVKYAESFWARKKGFKGEVKSVVFAQDARRINEVPQDLSRCSIVTEGYLGYRFGSSPSRQEIERELELQEKIWLDVLKSSAEKRIKEVIFCLPYYQKSGGNTLPTFIDELADTEGYRLEKFNGQTYILYSREKTNVGHYIVKAILK